MAFATDSECIMILRRFSKKRVWEGLSVLHTSGSHSWDASSPILPLPRNRKRKQVRKTEEELKGLHTALKEPE